MPVAQLFQCKASNRALFVANAEYTKSVDGDVALLLSCFRVVQVVDSCGVGFHSTGYGCICFRGLAFVVYVVGSCILNSRASCATAS